MFARSTWIQARLSSLDAGVAMIRNDVLPAVQAMDGCIGLSMMADRHSGRLIVTSAWESRDAMRASDAAVAHLRERAGRLLGGEPYVEEWEIAGLHRHHHSHQGACARVVWMHGLPPATPEKMEMGRDFFKMVMLPTLEQTEGFCSASLFIDPMTMRAVSSVVFDSRASMDASRESAAKLKELARTQLAVDILEAAEFDLLVAHLRVPEMV